MPPVINSIELSQFYFGTPPLSKSIQKTFRYTVTFFPNLHPTQTQAELFGRVGAMPLVQPWHVKSVSIPQYSFEKETQFYGPVPRSFPQLKYDGFEVRITFEEDDKGTIGNLISWLQRSIINPSNGTYTPPDAIKIPMIGIVTENDDGAPIGVYTLHDAFYLNASGSDLDYSTNDKMEYNVTFNVDIINSFFPQAAAFSALTSLVLGAL